jgi:hypothetical protein
MSDDMISIVSSTETTTVTITELKINFLSVDLQSGSLVANVSSIDSLGNVNSIDNVNIAGSDFSTILNVSALDAYVATSLGYTQN